MVVSNETEYGDLPVGAQKRWAIQVATTDLGAQIGLGFFEYITDHRIEHSYTRFSEIWCDSDGNPLTDVNDQLLQPIQVRGELHGGAIDSETGKWGAADVNISTVDQALDRVTDTLTGAFNNSSWAKVPGLSVGVSFLTNVWDKASGKIFDWVNDVVYGEDSEHDQPSKLGIKSRYGDFKPTEPEEVETIVVSDSLETMETAWLGLQDKALQIEAMKLDYDLSGMNCHTVTAEVAEDYTDFLREGTLRLGADPDSLQTSFNPDLFAGLSLQELQEQNRGAASDLHGEVGEGQGYEKPRLYALQSEPLQVDIPQFTAA